MDGVFVSGQVRVRVDAPAGPGVLLVRQEAVRVDPGGDVEGVVVRTSYTGTAVKVWLDSGGTEIALVVEPTARVSAGDRLRVTLPPEHCVVVPPG